jgi:hypothetical protein
LQRACSAALPCTWLSASSKPAGSRPAGLQGSCQLLHLMQL